MRWDRSRYAENDFTALSDPPLPFVAEGTLQAQKL